MKASHAKMGVPALTEFAYAQPVGSAKHVQLKTSVMASHAIVELARKVCAPAKKVTTAQTARLLQDAAVLCTS